MEKKTILGLVAAVLLLAAVGILYSSYASNPDQAVHEQQAEEEVTIRCAGCGAEMKMAFSEYQRRKEARADKNAELKCDKCGEARAWKVPNWTGELPPVPEEMAREAYDGRSEQPSEDSRPTPSKPRPAMGPKKVGG
ncbi:MAG: hypothetical protein HUU22_12505 [Phycisphaerae bacterium]|nr:hypothetical protein [Phycisphaerae bacterium]NUQ46838.1 hypothetical protein [Phycisphaerae bacterium]